MNSERLGSFLYMKRRGATTLYETWNGSHSHSHPMFGASVRHLFSGILGIRQEYGSFGYERISFVPSLPSEMNFASGSIETVRGTISVSLSRDKDRVICDVKIPE